jgi:hypothetical protein
MRGLFAISLGLLFMGVGLYAAAAVTPTAFPGAFDAQGHTMNVVALFVMLSITLVTAAFAGWITARSAEDHQMGHAVMMATLGLATAAGSKRRHRRRIDPLLTPPGRPEPLLDDARVDRQAVPSRRLLIGHRHRRARLDERAHDVEHDHFHTRRRKYLDWFCINQ